MDPARPQRGRVSRAVRVRTVRSLHNIVHAHPQDRHCKRESKVVKLLEVTRRSTYTCL